MAAAGDGPDGLAVGRLLPAKPSLRELTIRSPQPPGPPPVRSSGVVSEESCTPSRTALDSCVMTDREAAAVCTIASVTSSENIKTTSSTLTPPPTP